MTHDKAIAEKYLRGAEYTQSAVNALDLIADLQIPDLNESSDPLQVFPQHELGLVFAGIVETHGYITYGAGGYPQLRGSDGQERFLATYYPEKRQGGKKFPGAFHAYITSIKLFGSPNYTIPITIPVESGLPIVTRNERGDYGQLIYGRQFDPKASFAEVQHLANLMSQALQGGETDPGTFEVIG